MRLYGRMRSRNSWMQLKDKDGKLPVINEKSLQAAIDIKAPILITNESELIIRALQERSLH